jgi:hypothetical protein
MDILGRLTAMIRIEMDRYRRETVEHEAKVGRYDPGSRKLRAKLVLTIVLT